MADWRYTLSQRGHSASNGRERERERERAHSFLLLFSPFLKYMYTIHYMIILVHNYT